MQVIAQIKDKLDILDVVKDRVTLSRKGKVWQGLCPFHGDKNTPSFTVFQDSQRWKCFGACDDGGDVFDFVMRLEGWEMSRAIVELAARAGVTLPKMTEERQQQIQVQREKESVMDVAVRFWEARLARAAGGQWTHKGVVVGSDGAQYAMSRGWSVKVITKARLGYWDGDRAALKRAFDEAGVGNHGAVQAALAVPIGSLVYPHLRAGKPVYFAARGVQGKVHWNPPRDLVGERKPFFNSAWRRSAARVVVVEGQGDAVTLAMWGVAAVALAGAGADEGLVKMLQQHKTVVLGLDSDEAGHAATRKVARELGPLVRVVEWPDHDVNDWAQDGGCAEACGELLDGAETWLNVLIRMAAKDEDDEELVREVFAAMVHLDAFALARNRQIVADRLALGLGTFDQMIAVARQEAGLDQHGRTLYQLLGGKICRRSYDRNGAERIAPLCNFQAFITRDVVEDDGEMQERRFLIDGQLATGKTLAQIEVEAAEFGQMNWIPTMWGASAFVSAGGAAKDHLRVAIQTLSVEDGREVETQYKYSHFGWRKIAGKWAYLSAAGAVGVDGVQVRVIRDLERYKLPIWPNGDSKRAMETSLRFMDTGDEAITLPLWAAMYLAPLASVCPPSFTIWLFGTTGSMKSTATALAMCHYGRFVYNTPPASWTGTANALEKKAFLVKDGPLWIDDFTTQATAQGMNEIRKKSDQLLREWGNRSGRSRMRSDLKLRRSFAPRGLIISTAEVLPPGQSILSRLFSIEVHPGMMTSGAGSALTVAQREDARLYPQAMAGYVQWLAQWYDQLEERMGEKLMGYTERAQSEGQHLRVPMNVATMMVGLEMGLRYARAVDAIDEGTMEGRLDAGWHLLMALGEEQQQVVVEERPVEMYISALEDMFAQGTIYLSNKGNPEAAERRWPSDAVGNAEKIGWYDDQYWYLISKATFNAVIGFYRRGGRMFPDSERGIRAKLLEKGLLLPQGDRFSCVIRIGGSVKRVMRIHIPMETGDTSTEVVTSVTSVTSVTKETDILF